MSRETILAALATRLSAQRAPWPALTAGTPFTLLADGTETVVDQQYDSATIALTVGVRRAVGFSGTDAQRATAANDALAALIADAMGGDRTLGGLCLNLQYVEGNTEYPTESSELVGAIAVFSILYERTF